MKLKFLLLSGLENKMFCDFQMVKNLILTNFNATKMEILAYCVLGGGGRNTLRAGEKAWIYETFFQSKLVKVGQRQSFEPFGTSKRRMRQVILYKHPV